MQKSNSGEMILNAAWHLGKASLGGIDLQSVPGIKNYRKIARMYQTEKDLRLSFKPRSLKDAYASFGIIPVKPIKSRKSK